LAGKIAGTFINSKLTALLVGAAILLGAGAIMLLPREEEPQIVVPMVDLFVQMPGATAKEVEERVTGPMEKLLWEIPGVEYVYSTSSPGYAMVIVRFYVGEDEEEAIVRLNQKMFANMDLVPQGVTPPLIKPRSIDDVPILALTLWSEEQDHFQLRRVAAQLSDHIKQVDSVSQVTLIGGQRRQVRVSLDPERLNAFGIDPLMVTRIVQSANLQLQSGSISSGNREILVETGGFLRDADEVGSVVVTAFNGRPVYLRDVAEIIDGPEEASDYVLFGRGQSARYGHEIDPGGGHADSVAKGNLEELYPAVTISISKRKGSNATLVANEVIRKVENLQGILVPEDVNISITRNYGETAAEKSDELLFHMLLAIISVSILVWLTLGWRESGIVGIAIPVTLALTLVVFYFLGYTLNRVTLFALIFSIGILVDDAIVVVENIVRHYRLPENRHKSVSEVALEAVSEVGNPTILATWAVIAAILPMAFVRGLMGPYMRPIPIGASAAMIFSLIVAFVVTPWASLRLLKREHASEGGGEDEWGGENEGWSTRFYRKMMNPLIINPFYRWMFLGGVTVLLLAALSLFAFKAVTVKMLPFDNKSEFQVVIDMPEGSTLEQTAAVTREIALKVAEEPDVVNYQMYIGTAAPYNFNGLVRHYFLRREPFHASIQINLAPLEHRDQQSHVLAKKVRPGVQAIAAEYGAAVKVAEVPPGPPVLQTLVAEIYGPDYQRQLELAGRIETIFRETEGVVDVDSYTEEPQPGYRFDIDREKAALSGVSVEQVVSVLNLSVDGVQAGILHDPLEKEDVDIVLQLPREGRASLDDLKRIRVVGSSGRSVTLGELVQVRETAREQSIYHKNLMPVVYVTGDVAGAAESPVYAIGELQKRVSELKIPENYEIEQFTASLPFDSNKLAVKWDGEWHITYEVFRDMGLAFAAVLVLIYLLVVGWFQSLIIPLVIMAAIPFSLVGILPAHWGMGAFFTATSMIGFIAGAGIVVRNSIILVDFIILRLEQGMPLDEAVVDAGAVRFRPMMLTAAAVVVGASVILFDPIFQGLAISLMAGEIASLFLSRLTVPILFYMVGEKSGGANFCALDSLKKRKAD